MTEVGNKKLKLCKLTLIYYKCIFMIHYENQIVHINVNC